MSFIEKKKIPQQGIKGKEFIDLITKTGGEHGKRPKRSEVEKFFKGTEISRKPYAHLSRDKAVKELERAYENFGIKTSGKKLLPRELEKMSANMSVKRSPARPAGPGLLSRLFGGRRTVSNQSPYGLSEQRRVGSLLSQQPPVQSTPPPSSVAPLNQGPNFPPTKLPPNIARPK